MVKVLSRYSNHPRAKVIGFYADESRRIRPITAPPEQRLEERRHEIESKIVSRPPPPTASTPSKPSRFRGFTVLSLVVNPDHVHLFISANPMVPAHKIIKMFKGKTSKFLRREFPELLKLPSLWTRSYFVSTAGNVSAETI